MRLLFLGKAGDPFARSAAEYLGLHGAEIEAHACVRDRSLPEPSHREYDYLISYLCPKVVPRSILSRVRSAALNFHPGPPDYPGIGCTNFALYDGVREFGVTCHHMAPRVDSGPLVRVLRFPVRESDTVLSLTRRCHAYIAQLFYEMADLILDAKPLPSAPESWTRPPLRRRELDALCRITPDLDAEEVARRVRATSYPGQPGAFVEIGAHRFEYAAD